MEKPDATSTPTSMPVLKGRKSIKDHNSVQSPIDLETSRHQYETRSQYRTMESSYESSTRKSPGQSPKRSPREYSKRLIQSEANRSGSHDVVESDHSSESEGLSSDDADYEPHRIGQDQQVNSGSSAYGGYGSLLILLAVIAAGMAGLYLSDSSSDSDAPHLTLNIHQEFDHLEKEFKKQEDDFWRHIKVNIQEISLLDQPKTILFLYSNKAEKTLNKVLQKVSSIALCNLSQCSNNAVVIEGASLNNSEVVTDYGKIISKYRDSLEKNGVMIVKNLEKVPGGSAQAFHSFCDDYNPVVKKALILFTIKVDNLPEGYPMKFLEKYLLELWKDIGKDDKFYPLFTRISGTILSVRPE